MPTRSLLPILALVICASTAASQAPRREPPPVSEDHDLVAEMVASEELLLDLGTVAHRLAKSVMNLRFPDPSSGELFGDELVWRDLKAVDGHVVDEADRLALSLRKWKASDHDEQGATADADLWRPLLDQVAWFEHGKFKIVKGHFLDGGRDRWEAQMVFKGTARTADGEPWGVKVEQDVIWRKNPDGPEEGPGSWVAEAWRTTSAKTIEAETMLFEDVLDAALPDARLLARAQTCLHEAKVVEYVKDKKPQAPYFQLSSFDRHPGISAVDIDDDGLDDLYVMARWGKNQLLRNRGDGTFEDVAAHHGLDFADHCSSALFADFDNDGDPDLFLGRTVLPSLYLENEDGTFVDRSAERFGERLPSFVSSVSAADYDGDGLLDVHVSTYLAAYIGSTYQKVAKDGAAFEGSEYLAKGMKRSEFAQLVEQMQADGGTERYFSRAGPPNVLFRNKGAAGFERADEDQPVFLYRNSYQSTWSDFDHDGDPDLYTANDFSTNHLFRNDDGVFVDITELSETGDIGFGMGASWGDYDQDGRFDLYVSNMFSKAGRRITAQLPMVDERLAQMARGNSLFRNAMPFDKVSDAGREAEDVEIVGWSYGSQFVDVDNDGWLDLYALSGFFTAPKDIAQPIDL
jgi:hypothetical protein